MTRFYFQVALSIFLCNVNAFAIEGWKNCTGLYEDLYDNFPEQSLAERMETVLKDPEDTTTEEILSDQLIDYSHLNELYPMMGQILRYSIELRRPNLEEKTRTTFLTERNQLLSQWIEKVRGNEGIPDFLRAYVILTSGADPRTAEFIPLAMPQRYGLDEPLYHYTPLSVSAQSTHLTNLFSFLSQNKPNEFNVPWNNHPLAVDRKTANSVVKNLNQLDSRYEYAIPTAYAWSLAAAFHPESRSNLRALIQSPFDFQQDIRINSPYFNNSHAWYSLNATGIQPVATTQRTSAGFYDLLGNVYDLVQDGYYGRGGAWYTEANVTHGEPIEFNHSDIFGLRLLREEKSKGVKRK